MNSGVYKIINLINNKLYVGSSSNLRKRERDHFTELERGVHKNKHLQSAYKLYNKDSFKFELIENCINDELIKRDKVNLDIFWLKDEALEDSANLPAPGIIAADIVQDLEAALEQFRDGGDGGQQWPPCGNRSQPRP